MIHGIEVTMAALVLVLLLYGTACAIWHTGCEFLRCWKFKIVTASLILLLVCSSWLLLFCMLVFGTMLGAWD